MVSPIWPPSSNGAENNAKEFALLFRSLETIPTMGKPQYVAGHGNGAGACCILCFVYDEACHTCTVPSRLAEAIRFPSGDHATDSI